MGITATSIYWSKIILDKNNILVIIISKRYKGGNDEKKSEFYS